MKHRKWRRISKKAHSALLAPVIHTQMTLRSGFRGVSFLKLRPVSPATDCFRRDPEAVQTEQVRNTDLSASAVQVLWPPVSRVSGSPLR